MASRTAADCVEEWDTVDHSDEPRLCGSDLTVVVDPETGTLLDDWYEPEEFEELVERLCGPEVVQQSDSEDEEPEMEEPETERDGEGDDNVELRYHTTYNTKKTSRKTANTIANNKK